MDYRTQLESHQRRERIDRALCRIAANSRTEKGRAK